MQCLCFILVLSLVGNISTKNCQDLLHDADRRDIDEDTARLFYRETDRENIEHEIEHDRPDTAEETDHCRFDLQRLNEHGHKHLIKQLHNAGYKLCVGCGHNNEQRHCHSIEVCEDDAVCINGSFANPQQLDAYGLHTEPWYGCCKKDDDHDCETDNNHFHVHGTRVEYQKKTCKGPLCNAGTQFNQYVREFNNIFHPKVSGGWTHFTLWSACDVTCGGGNQSRERNCTNPPPRHGGEYCSGDKYEFRKCNTQTCPVNGGWTNFTLWSACDVSCGGGNQSRERNCTNPSPTNGGHYCSGNKYEFKKCNTQTCPGWTKFTLWTACDVTCGGGNQSRERNCTNPSPSHGGHYCSGNKYEFQKCNTQSCPVNGGWTNYTPWSPCDVSCGGGNQLRERNCTNPSPRSGGHHCLGYKYEVQNCNTQICPEWSSWSQSSSCNLTGGVCLTHKTRNCSTGDTNDCNGTYYQINQCAPHQCCNAKTPGNGCGSSVSSTTTKSTGSSPSFTTISVPSTTFSSASTFAFTTMPSTNPSSAKVTTTPVVTVISSTTSYTVKSAGTSTSSGPVPFKTTTRQTNINGSQTTSATTLSTPSYSSTKHPVSATHLTHSTMKLPTISTPRVASTSVFRATSTKLPVTSTNSAATTRRPLIMSTTHNKTLSPSVTDAATVSSVSSPTTSSGVSLKSGTTTNIALIMSTSQNKKLTPLVSTTSTKTSNASLLSTTKLSVTASKSSVTKLLSSSSMSPNTTTVPSVTTTKSVATLPPNAIMCAQCAGPPEACELAYYEDLCQPPNHYCINHVTNLASGDKLVERKCGNIHDCYHDWYLGTSDDDKCRRLSASTVLTYKFECTYCCITDSCNVDLRPDHNTLYTNAG